MNLYYNELLIDGLDTGMATFQGSRLESHCIRVLHGCSTGIDTGFFARGGGGGGGGDILIECAEADVCNS